MVYLRKKSIQAVFSTVKEQISYRMDMGRVLV